MRLICLLLFANIFFVNELLSQYKEPAFISRSEVMPKFKNGTMKDFVADVYSQLKYPTDICSSQSLTVISFVINEEGNVESPVIRRSIYKSIDEQLLQIICNYEFIPGTMYGKPVPVNYNLPIRICVR